MTTPELLTDLLLTLRESGRSESYIRGLRRDLMSFAAAHADLSAITRAQITAWLREHHATAGTRRRDNVRDAIVRLFRFARDNGHLDELRRTEAERVPRLDRGPGEISVYTPAEIEILLGATPAPWRPWFLLAAFAGLRTSEIFRLDWRSIHWDDREISVGKSVARKTRTSRRLPMCESLAALLGEYRECLGPLYHYTCERALAARHMRAIGVMTRSSGIAWRRNALRHSYGSHRLAVCRDEAMVALEMGTSVRNIREHYHAPRSRRDAERYFSIRPADNVLYLPLYFSK